MEKMVKNTYDLLIMFGPFWTPYMAPMGPALLKAYLKKERFSSYALDLNVELFNSASPKFKEYWEAKNGFYYPEDITSVKKYYESIETSRAYYISKIVSLKPKRVGMSLYTATRLFSELFLEELKHFMPNTEFIIGGPHIATYMNNEDYYLSKSYIDVLVQGEGEIAITEYLKNADDPKFKDPINNIIYKRDGEVIRGKYVSNVINLNSIPVPDYSDYDLGNYINKNGLNIFASRGCPNKCVFCSERNYFSNFKFRKAEIVFNDIKELKEKYPYVQDFNFADSISNASARELEKLCDLIIESKIEVNLILQNAVIRKEMRAPLYKKLKAAGCRVIGYGMETPEPRVLDYIGKTLSRKVDIGAVVKEGKEAGIDISVNVMFGLPGETEEDFNNLIQFLREHKDDLWQVNPAINFCAFWEGSFGHMNPEKWNIDLGDSPDYWEIKEDNNTFLTRLERYEKFSKLAKSYGIHNLFEAEEPPNKNEMLGLYYFNKKDFETSRKYLQDIPQSEMTMSVEKALSVINNNAPNSSGVNVHKTNYLIPKYKNRFISAAMTMINTDTSNFFQDIERSIFRRSLPEFVWKQKVRKLGQAAFGLRSYEEKVQKVLSLCFLLQKANVVQNSRIAMLLETCGFKILDKKQIKTGNDVNQFQKNENCKLGEIKIIKDNILKTFEKKQDSFFKPFYQFTGYNKLIDGIVPAIGIFQKLAIDLQRFNERMDEIDTKFQSCEDTKKIFYDEFDEQEVLIKDRKFCDIDESIREKINNLFVEKDNDLESSHLPQQAIVKKLSGILSNASDLTKKVINTGEIYEKLASIYRVLRVVNHQNSCKAAVLDLIEDSLHKENNYIHGSSYYSSFDIQKTGFSQTNHVKEP